MAGFIQALIYVSVITLVLIYSIYSLHTASSAKLLVAQLTTSKIITDKELLYWRLLPLATNLYVHIHNLLDKKGFPITAHTIDTKPKTFQMVGLVKLATFTIWCWTLQGIYFALAICTQLGYIQNSYLLETIVIAFEVATAQAILVTVVVSFVLAPEAVNKDIENAKGLFSFAVLLTHNANVIFMVTELVLNNIQFKLEHLPFVAMFGIIYLVFSWILASKIGVFFYFFINYNFKYALKAYTGLLTALSIFFIIAFSISHYLNPKENLWAIPLLGVLVWSICLFKMPNPVKKSE